MKLSLSSLIRMVLIILIISTLAMCLFWAPHAVDYALGFISPELKDMARPLLFTVGTLMSTPLFIIFIISFKFCSEIKTNTIFSSKTANRLKLISIIIFIDCAIFTAGIVWFFCLGERVLSPALAFVDAIGLTVALMLATLSNYVREAAVLKEEADYTL